jgi:hypothetical protein
MVNVDFDARRFQRALKKAIGAINNFDWTGLRLAHRVPCTADCLGRQLHEALELLVPIAADGSEYS